MATTSPRAQVPLQIKFIDAIRPVKMGRELRFEVVRTDRPTERVPFDQLDFSFAPVLWGIVGPGAEPGLGVVKVVALAKSRDVYDKPKYEMTATYKARGDTQLETGNLFALAYLPPVVELRFYVREDDPSEDETHYEEFDPQKQGTPLKSGDIKVDPPHAADIFEQGGRFFARILKPTTTGTIIVTFPNGEKATVILDVRHAGKRPEELARLSEAQDALEDESEAPPSIAGIGGGSPVPPAPKTAPAPVPAPVSVPAPVWSAKQPEPEEAEPSGDDDESEEVDAPAAAPEIVPSPALATTTAPAVAAPSSPAAAPAPASASGRAAAPGAAKVDPSFALRREISNVRREVETAREGGLIPTGVRDRLVKKIAFFKKAAEDYKGPDKDAVLAHFESTLGTVEL